MSHAGGDDGRRARPGSPEAIRAGCQCPVLPNSPRLLHGHLLPVLIAPDCPLHRLPAPEPHSRDYQEL